MEWSVYLELKGSSCLLLNFLVFFYSLVDNGIIPVYVVDWTWYQRVGTHEHEAYSCGGSEQRVSKSVSLGSSNKLEHCSIAICLRERE